MTTIIIIEAAQRTGDASPLASAVSLSVKTFFVARGFSLSSYEEDENFKPIADSLYSIDQMRLAAKEFEEVGNIDRAAKLYLLANKMRAFAVENTRSVFTGHDGEVIGKVFVGFDEVIMLWRDGNHQAAEEKYDEIAEIAYEDHGGLTNDFYERFFMLFRARDTVRAFNELARVMKEALSGHDAGQNPVQPISTGLGATPSSSTPEPLVLGPGEPDFKTSALRVCPKTS